MKIRWEFVAIPTITYVSVLFQMNRAVIPICWKYVAIGYLIFNGYTLTLATFSKYKAEYLKVFLPYAFLPVFWKIFKMVFIEQFFSLYAVFLISVLCEFVSFKKPSFYLILSRLAILNLLVWGMHRWLTNIWSLF